MELEQIVTNPWVVLIGFVASLIAIAKFACEDVPRMWSYIFAQRWFAQVYNLLKSLSFFLKNLIILVHKRQIAQFSERDAENCTPEARLYCAAVHF
jgi:hypothetical protein